MRRFSIGLIQSPFIPQICFGTFCLVLGPAFGQDTESKNKSGVESSDSAATAAQIEAPTEVDFEATTTGGLQTSVLLRDLNNPCGIAIQPETGAIFISDSGNFQIGKLADGKLEPVITEFPNDVYGKGPKVNVGPMGMLFLNKETLIVGGGGRPDGEELLRVYELPEAGKTIKADQLAGSFALAADDDKPGEGNFYALAKLGEHIYVTCNGDDEKGWVSRATIEEGRLTGFERYLATKEATGVNAPVGITVSPIGGYLVVGQMGAINEEADSLITFYDASSGKMLQPLIKCGLHDVCAVAYSPRRQMYCLDYSWADPSKGGLFQIIEDKSQPSGVRARKVLSLDKPTAMAFDSDGSLLITVRGSAKESDSNGALVKIAPGL